MSLDLTPFKKIIVKNGYEFTLQKQIILKTIINSEIHLTVKEIYEKIKDRGIGISTIYRSLNMFRDLGIVKEININGTSYYEMKIFSGKPLHIHFKCSKCNKIIDIDDSDIDVAYLKLNRKVEQLKNLSVHDADIMLIGVCKECKGKNI